MNWTFSFLALSAIILNYVQGEVIHHNKVQNAVVDFYAISSENSRNSNDPFIPVDNPSLYQVQEYLMTFPENATNSLNELLHNYTLPQLHSFLKEQKFPNFGSFLYYSDSIVPYPFPRRPSLNARQFYVQCQLCDNQADTYYAVNNNRDNIINVCFGCLRRIENIPKNANDLTFPPLLNEVYYINPTNSKEPKVRLPQLNAIETFDSLLDHTISLNNIELNKIESSSLKSQYELLVTSLKQFVSLHFVFRYCDLTKLEDPTELLMILGGTMRQASELAGNIMLHDPSTLDPRFTLLRMFNERLNEGCFYVYNFLQNLASYGNLN